MDWKIIGLSGLINAILTVIISWIFLPLFFLGPIIGGFLASYMAKGFEDYEGVDAKDGAVLGTLSGIIGGLILGLLLILGLGNLNPIISSISGLGGFLINGYIIIQLSVIISLIFGLIGGIIGAVVKK